MVYIAKNEEETSVKHEVKETKVLPPKGGGLSGQFDFVMSQISPQTALYLGLVTSIMTVCTIGFIILLWITVK